MKYYRVLYPIKIFIFLFGIYLSGFAQQGNELKLAENLLRARNYKSALLHFQNAYKNGDSSNRVVNGLSTCLRELAQNDQLILLLNEITRKYPENYSYSIQLGEAYFLNDQPDSALLVWENVYMHDPPDLMRHRLVAQAMTRYRLFDEAISVYKRALKLIPNQEIIHLDIATLYKAQLNYEQASQHYLQYYKMFKNQQNYVRSQLINMAKDEDAADRIIISILDFNDDNDPDLNELLANLYMRKKDYAKAFEIVVEIEKKMKNDNLVYLNRFASEAARDNAYNYVIKAYEYALTRVKTNLSPAVKFNLAQAYYLSALELNKQNNIEESGDQVKKALNILSELVQGNTVEKYRALELSADIYKDQFNDLDGALQNYEKIKFNRIGSNEADQVRLKIANVYLLKNNLADAENYYRKVKTKKFLSLAHYNLAELLFFTSRFSKAKQSFESLITQVGMKDTLANNALERNFQIEQFLGDSIHFSKFSQASLLKRQQKYSEAAKKFGELYFSENVTSFASGMEAVTLYNRLKKMDEANQILEDMIKTYPDEDNSDYAYFLLANNYKNADKLQDALTMYQEILIRFPTSFYIEEARSRAREINSILQENVNN